MFHHLVDTGSYNATLWFALAAFVALRLRWLPRNRIALGAIFAALLLGTSANLALALYRGYAVPRDIMQDIVSAQEYLEGRPLYPSDMTQRINVALSNEAPRASIFERWPNLRKREENQLHEMLTSQWVQAHPPFMTLFTAPFVKYLGVLGTQIAFVAIGLICLALTLFLIRVELFPNANGWHTAIIATAIAGSDSVLTVLRSGQTGLLLGCLLTSSWVLLRRGRPGWAGVAAGIAVSLKLVPGVILLVLAMRHRKAFIAAIATVASAFLFSLLLTSTQDFAAHYNTSRDIVESYASYSGNVSLLGTLSRGLRSLDLAFSVARLLWLACGVTLGIAFAWQIRKPPAPVYAKVDIDLQYALAMTLMPILSPVAWDHYMVYLILPLSILASRVQMHKNHRLALGLVGLLVIFAIPDAVFHWTLAQCSQEGLHGVGIWLALNLRIVGLGLLTVWLSREISRIPRQKAGLIESGKQVTAASALLQPQMKEQLPRTMAAE